MAWTVCVSSQVCDKQSNDVREWDDRILAAKGLTEEFQTSVNDLLSSWSDVDSKLQYVEGKQAVLEVSHGVGLGVAAPYDLTQPFDR